MKNIDLAFTLKNTVPRGWLFIQEPGDPHTTDISHSSRRQEDISLKKLNQETSGHGHGLYKLRSGARVRCCSEKYSMIKRSHANQNHPALFPVLPESQIQALFLIYYYSQYIADTNQLEWTLALALRQSPSGFDPLIAGYREYESQKGQRGSGQQLYDTSKEFQYFNNQSSCISVYQPNITLVYTLRQEN